MNTLPLSPVPHMPKGWTYNFQRDIFDVRGADPDLEILGRLDALACGIENTCHRFGVTVTKATIYHRGKNLDVYLDLVAGDWNKTWHARTTTLGHITGRLCSRILRFLDASHEELG